MVNEQIEGNCPECKNKGTLIMREHDVFCSGCNKIVMTQIDTKTPKGRQEVIDALAKAIDSWVKDGLKK